MLPQSALFKFYFIFWLVFWGSYILYFCFLSRNWETTWRSARTMKLYNKSSPTPRLWLSVWQLQPHRGESTDFHSVTSSQGAGRDFFFLNWAWFMPSKEQFHSFIVKMWRIFRNTHSLTHSSQNFWHKGLHHLALWGKKWPYLDKRVELERILMTVWGLADS